MTKITNKPVVSKPEKKRGALKNESTIDFTKEEIPDPNTSDGAVEILRRISQNKEYAKWNSTQADRISNVIGKIREFLKENPQWEGDKSNSAPFSLQLVQDDNSHRQSFDYGKILNISHPIVLLRFCGVFQNYFKSNAASFEDKASEIHQNFINSIKSEK